VRVGVIVGSVENAKFSTRPRVGDADNAAAAAAAVRALAAAAAAAAAVVVAVVAVVAVNHDSSDGGKRERNACGVYACKSDVNDVTDAANVDAPTGQAVANDA
jgi:hypothetical protein